MALWNALRGLLRHPATLRRSPNLQLSRRLRARPLALETLEDRLCMSTVIDAHDLTVPYLILDHTEYLSTATVQSFDLSPGVHTLAHYTDAAVNFSISPAGTVDYDAALNDVLEGRGSTTLVVRGRTVDIDARALTVPQLILDHTFYFSRESVRPATVLPGTQILAHYAEAVVTFSVSPSGIVDYDAALDNVLEGRGSSTLVVRGRTVDIDAYALTIPQLILDHTFYFSTRGIFSATVLPGTQILAHYAEAVVTFSVSPSGTVDYDAALDDVLEGRGSSTLVVRGRTIDIDAYALTVPQLILDHTVYFSTRGTFSATVLPGQQFVLYNSGPAQPTVHFRVRNDGTITYAASLNDVLAGRDSMRLTVLGQTIHIDARALSSSASSFSLTGIGVFPTATVQPITLLPGWHDFRTTSVQLNFRATLFEGLDYDPVHGGIVTGSGTSTLRLLPRPSGGSQPGGSAEDSFRAPAKLEERDDAFVVQPDAALLPDDALWDSAYREVMAKRVAKTFAHLFVEAIANPELSPLGDRSW